VGLVSAAATPERGGVARFRVSTAYEAPARIADVPGSPPLIHTIPDPQDKAALEEDIRAAKTHADLVIVSWHWGVSPHSRGIGDLAAYQVEMGRASIDAGADLVVGHHSHVPQPIEVYKGKPIVYSLANYVHDMFEAERQLSTILVRCLIRDNKIARLAFVPGLVNGAGPPRFMKPREAARVVNHVVEISAPFGTRFEVGEDEVSVALEAFEPRNPLAEHAVSRSMFHWRRASGL
jgi:poly-gamma-glutamate synthesis protein (capsule biosynthesis protein)